MANWEELHELHIDQRRSRAETNGVTVTTHVGRPAVATVKTRQPTGRHYRRLGRNHDRGARPDVPGHRARHHTVTPHKIDDAKIARANYTRGLVHHTAQSLRDRRAGAEKIDVNATRPVVPRRKGCRDAAVLACPANAP